MAQWLEEQGSLATPHSQRSLVKVGVNLLAQNELGLMPLIRCIEQALKTPVQTLVKREDEQEFARLNGKNLMYVEDAARRVAGAVGNRYTLLDVNVEHFESLHGHNAVSRID